MKKEIQFSTKFDTSDFDKAVESMQKKLREIYAPADMIRQQTMTQQRLQQNGLGSSMSAPAQDAYAKATMTQRREMDQSIREQAAAQEKLSKIITKRVEKLAELKKIQAEGLSDLKEELALKEKIARREENTTRLREIYRGKNKVLNDSLTAREQMGTSLPAIYNSGPPGMGNGGNGTGGIAGGGGGRFGINGPTGAIGLTAAVLAGLGTVINGSVKAYRYLGDAPINAISSSGSAINSTIGGELNGVYNRSSAFNRAWDPERRRAIALAGEATDRYRQTQTLDVGGSLLKSGAVGMGAGATAGAAIGSLGGPIGTAVGAGVGGAIGAAGGVAYGAYSMLSNPEQRATLLGNMGFKGAQQDQQGMLAKQFAENLAKALEGEQNANPLKKRALDEYQGNFQRNLDFQRSLGLNFDSFHGKGGYREQAINAGFTDEQAMGMSNTILGAGGSTRMARDSAFGLQLQRGADLTNAGSVLGTLSGGMGSSEATKAATIKLLAEGTKLGLDSSQFREENRKFADIAAQTISTSGTSSAGGIDEVLGRLGGFMADRSSKGIEAGKSAYEGYQQMSTASTGPQGIQRAAGLLRDDKIGAMDTMDRMALSNLPDNQLTEDNDVVRDLARRYNMDPKDLIRRRVGVDQASFNRSSKGSDLQKRLSDFKQQTGSGSISESGVVSLKYKDMLDEYGTQILAQHPEITDPRQRRAYAEGTTNPGGSSISSILEDAKKKQIENPETGRVEDQTNRAAAEDSRIIIKTFQDMRDQIAPTVEAVAKFNKELQNTVDVLMKLPESERGGALQTLYKNLYGGGNQTQSGKPGK